MTIQVPFDNTYARLPDRFFARVSPTPVVAPKLVRLNRDLASHLNLDPDWLASPEGVEVLAGKQIPEGADPIAMAYAGHQFGGFVPQLGDGRAILLGEVIDRDGIRRDIQLKGAGRTPFSRNGDGRAALGPALREYLISEAMAALGIPTTRALAVVLTGEGVARETVLPGAVFARVASSHIRVGTFQFFAARGDTEGLRLLADYLIARQYKDVAETEEPYRALFDQVILRQADLIAKWLLVGFIHGVMNTDNMSVAGETIDYGPCAFMDEYNPAMVLSSIDRHGRYAYANQPSMALWNLSRLAEAMLPLFSDDEEQAINIAKDALGHFESRFHRSWLEGMRRKLGLLVAEEEDLVLVRDLLNAMAENQADFTNTFRRLSDASADPAGDGPVRELFLNSAAYDGWAARWRIRLGRESQDPDLRPAMMRAANPAFIPRNHRVEAVIEAAVNRQDFGPFEELLAVLATPYQERSAFAHYADPPGLHERVRQTFCGT